MPPERTAQTYGPGVTGASKSVLLEVLTALRAYRDALVLVGGWAPYFLLEEFRQPRDPFVHVGSIDIDLAIDPAKLDAAQYATIAELLGERGYRPASDRKGEAILSSLERTIQSPVNAKSYTIRVDFLTSPGVDPAGRRRESPVQDGLMARKLKGCDAAFRYQTTIELAATLPDGGRMRAPMRMADLVSCLTMKGIVLGERYREKDAYDIYALLAHHRGGPAEAASRLRPALADPLVAEAMANIRTAFDSREAHGPAWVAAFLNPAFANERERMLTDAFMTVHEFLERLHRHEPKPARLPT